MMPIVSSRPSGAASPGSEASAARHANKAPPKTLRRIESSKEFSLIRLFDCMPGLPLRLKKRFGRHIIRAGSDNMRGESSRDRELTHAPAVCDVGNYGHEAPSRFLHGG